MAASAPHVAVFAAVLLLFPSLLAPVAAQQAKAQAFCISQFAIASQACSILPPSPPEEEERKRDDDDDDDDDDHGSEGDRRARGRRGHAAISVASLSLMANNDSTGHGRNVNGTGHHGNHTRGGRGRLRGRGRRGHLGDGDGGADQGGGGDDSKGGGDSGGGGDDSGGDEDPDHDDDYDDDEDPDHDDHDDDQDDDDDDDHDDDHGHEQHHDEELRAYRDCCRWLQEVQKDCVCQALLRLPPFLVKPQHKYVVRVGRTCRIVYRCGGV